MLEPKPRVLVLCTGNSCRSQMAAAYLRSLSGDRLEVSSAGTEPAASVHPLAVEVMAEDGLDLASQRPQDYRPFLAAERIDYLIVVCDGAARACPASWPGVENRLSWPFEDPAAFVGPPAETIDHFRRVRDEIKERTQRWLASMDETLSPRIPAQVS